MTQPRLRHLLAALHLILAALAFSLSAGLSLKVQAEELPNVGDEPMGSRKAIPLGPADCGTMEIWDYPTTMCMPRAMAGMKMKMLMAHGNGFLNQNFSEGPRGHNSLTLPDMFMADVGSSMGDHHYVNFDFMGTAERWAYPTSGYPELLQIGEHDAEGNPFIDHQHPHITPIMGLTLSDTISIGDDHDYAKIAFSPRGQSTDGPIAFMHRVTGMMNPDAPLGHHVGQDVGHISSTVLAGTLRIQNSTLELSTFNGTEPEPTSTDLRMGTMNSYATRLTQEFTKHLYAMASVAYVRSPEADEPTVDHIWRYSASLYTNHTHRNGWAMDHAWIYGLINGYDHTGALMSFGDEWWLRQGARNLWGRIEVLQRTAAELAIATGDNNRARWASAITLGYTHNFIDRESVKIGIGGSITKDFVPQVFESAYGGDPLTAKVFLQTRGMGMWNF